MFTYSWEFSVIWFTIVKIVKILAWTFDFCSRFQNLYINFVVQQGVRSLRLLTLRLGKVTIHISTLNTSYNFYELLNRQTAFSMFKYYVGQDNTKKAMRGWGVKPKYCLICLPVSVTVFAEPCAVHSGILHTSFGRLRRHSETKCDK